MTGKVEIYYPVTHPLAKNLFSPSQVALSTVVSLRWTRSPMSSSSFPPVVSSSGIPFPPPGPSGRFPGLSGNMGCSDSQPSIPPHFVSFAWRYQGCALCSLPWAQDAARHGPGYLISGDPTRSFALEMTGPPRFLGNPLARALLYDPGGTRNARPITAFPIRPSASITASAPASS